MGKLIEVLASQRAHEISVIVNEDNSSKSAGELADVLNGSDRLAYVSTLCWCSMSCHVCDMTTSSCSINSAQPAYF